MKTMHQQRRRFTTLVRYVLVEYVRSGTPLIEAGLSLAFAYLVFIGIDYSLIAATVFAEFSSVFLGLLGAVSATLLCRRAASARALTVLARLPGRAPYLLARAAAAWLVALAAYALAVALLLLAFQRRIEGNWPVLLTGATCAIIVLTFGVAAATLFSVLATPHRYRVGLLVYLAVLATALTVPSDAMRTVVTPFVYPVIPLIGTLKLAAQGDRAPVLVGAACLTAVLDAALMIAACRLFARRELVFE